MNREQERCTIMFASVVDPLMFQKQSTFITKDGSPQLDGLPRNDASWMAFQPEHILMHVTKKLYITRQTLYCCSNIIYSTSACFLKCQSKTEAFVQRSRFFFVFNATVLIHSRLAPPYELPI
ncbi:Hypothetical_protein [Hexamita inflata]|uniref:Hypothetical_protein n=1 Tax=Hexamita inflata TaxID=28002 RepID=A0AA86RCD8_9EUKA|nr:Hypothetical protein HINF_LOCUS58192 [Hexamita inflata]